jgi:hypothetical protein
LLRHPWTASGSVGIGLSSLAKRAIKAADRRLKAAVWYWMPAFGMMAADVAVDR